MGYARQESFACHMHFVREKRFAVKYTSCGKWATPVKKASLSNALRASKELRCQMHFVRKVGYARQESFAWQMHFVRQKSFARNLTMFVLFLFFYNALLFSFFFILFYYFLSLSFTMYDNLCLLSLSFTMYDNF